MSTSSNAPVITSYAEAPARTVTVVVTSAAGALTDVLTRAVSQRLSQMWGQSIVVEKPRCVLAPRWSRH